MSTWCHGELYFCLIFLTNTPPPFPNKRHTHIQTDFGVTNPPPLSSHSPPLPTQACDVTVSDNEVRILLHQSVRMTAAQAYVQPPWYQAPSADSRGLRPDTETALSGPPAMHFKVGDQGLTCACHPENDNGSASLHLLLRASHRDTKAYWLLPQYFAAWRKHSFRKGDIHIGRRQCSMCILYKYWWVKSNVRGRGKKAEETAWQQILCAVLFDC